MKIGCSPAYYFAHFGERLTYKDLLWSIRRVKELGFASLQLETYASNQVKFYTNPHIEEIKQLYNDLGLESSQFIIHSVKAGVTSSDPQKWKSAFEEIKYLLDICCKMEIIHTINIPSSPPAECITSYYETYPGAVQPRLHLPAGKHWNNFWSVYIEHIDRIADLIEPTNIRLAIEAVPHGMISNSDSMLRLIDDLPKRNLGFVIDTGHLHYIRESFPLLCNKIAGHIFGTHLNDNDGTADDHKPPGEGSIDWSELVQALKCNNYDDFLDIEINLSNNPDQTYLEAKQFLEDHVSALNI